MPTYEYACSNTECNHEWEEIHSITLPAITECPLCKLQTAKRLISSGSNFQLSGDGWARDNYSSRKD